MNENKFFRYTEKLLFSYPRKLECLGRLENCLVALRTCGDYHSPNYRQNFSLGTGNPSDPVAMHVEKVLALEGKIKKITLYIKPVYLFCSYLKELQEHDARLAKDYHKVLTLFFFDRHSLSEIATQLKLDIKTVSRIRRRIVYQVMGYQNFARVTNRPQFVDS